VKRLRQRRLAAHQMSARRSWHGGSIPLPLRAHRVDEFQSAQISLRRTCDRWSRLFASSWFQSSDVDLPNLFSLPLCWGECLVVMALVFFSLEAVVFALMTSPAHGQSDPRNPPLCRWAALAAQPLSPCPSCSLLHLANSRAPARCRPPSLVLSVIGCRDHCGLAAGARCGARECRSTCISPPTTIPGKTPCSTKLSRTNCINLGRRCSMSDVKV
jgi:hypothetical protein